MGYSSSTGVIIYWKADQTFVIHGSHHVWFDEYNYFLSINDKHTPGSLPLVQDTESCIHYSYLPDLIPCELDLTYTPFCDTKIITCEIELPHSSKNIGFNLVDDEDFTIPYVTVTIPN